MIATQIHAHMNYEEMVGKIVVVCKAFNGGMSLGSTH